MQLDIKTRMVRVKYEKMMEDMKERIEINVHNQKLAEKEIEKVQKEINKERKKYNKFLERDKEKI